MDSSDRLRSLKKQLGRLLAANAVILAVLALMPVALHLDLYTGGTLQALHVQPKLHDFCLTHRCSVSAAEVSTSYFLQGVYALLPTVIGSLVTLLSTLHDDRKTRITGSMSMLIITALFLFDDANGIDGGGLFSNYIHRNAVYLFHPTFPFLLVTSVAIILCWLAWNRDALVEALEALGRWPKRTA